MQALHQGKTLLQHLRTVLLLLDKAYLSHTTQGLHILRMLRLVHSPLLSRLLFARTHLEFYRHSSIYNRRRNGRWREAVQTLRLFSQ